MYAPIYQSYYIGPSNITGHYSDAKLWGQTMTLRVFALGATFSMLASFCSCEQEAGLYEQEKIVFEVNDPDDLDLSEEESSKWDGCGGMIGFYGAPFAPWPIFEYYQYPLPVLVPINPLTNLIEWIHPMYIGLFLDGEFGPRDL
jgi:hypothetical protein